MIKSIFAWIDLNKSTSQIPRYKGLNRKEYLGGRLTIYSTIK